MTDFNINRQRKKSIYCQKSFQVSDEVLQQDPDGPGQQQQVKHQAQHFSQSVFYTAEI